MNKISSSPSIVKTLAKQNAIHKRNQLIMNSLENSRMHRAMLDNPAFMGNLEATNAAEAALMMQQCSNETQLMALNAELSALNNIDYFA